MRAAAIGVFVLVMSVGRAGAQDAETSPSVLLLQQWIQAVEQHVPGALDPWVQNIAQLRYADRTRLDPVMTVFLRLVELQSRQELAVTRGGAQRRLSELAHQVGVNPGWGLFLKRAAILHADAAILTHNVGGFDDRQQGARVPSAAVPRCRFRRC